MIASARKLLIVARRMLPTGEVNRAAKPAMVARKHRELRKVTRIQLLSTVLTQHPGHGTRVSIACAGGTEGAKSRRRTLISA
jgi:hypothetical protein